MRSREYNRGILNALQNSVGGKKQHIWACCSSSHSASSKKKSGGMIQWSSGCYGSCNLEKMSVYTCNTHNTHNTIIRVQLASYMNVAMLMMTSHIHLHTNIYGTWTWKLMDQYSWYPVKMEVKREVGAFFCTRCTGCYVYQLGVIKEFVFACQTHYTV